MSQKQNSLLSLLLIICFLSLASCGQQASPVTTEPSPAQAAAAEGEVAEAGGESGPVEAGVRYLLTTAGFEAEEGYLTATRAGEGLMQIRRPRYETEQTYWSFTPAGEGYYHLRQAGQAETLAYDASLVAVATAEDKAQLWQIVSLDNGYYRLTNKALNNEKSLAASGEGMPYPGWGEVTLAETSEDETQYWVLTAVPEPEEAEEPPSRGAAAAVDTVIALAEAGNWQRGDQPYGELSGGKLVYDFSSADAAADFVLFQQPAGVEGQPNLITAQLEGDGSGHLFNIWIEDDQGEIWSIGLGQVSQGEQTLSGAIDPTSGWPTGYISGPQNGVIDYPIKFSGLVLDRAGEPAAGEITVETITFTTGEAPAAEVEAPVATEDNAEENEPTAEAETVAESETAPATTAGNALPTRPGATPNLGHLFEPIPLESPRDSRPAADHGDLNLRLRELHPIEEDLGLVEINGDTDEYAPNFVNVLEAKFVAVYTGYDWDWSCNCKGDLIENPWGQVAAVEVATMPGQPLYIPRRKFDIYQGKFYAVLLYANEDSLTFVYTREDNIANGYAVYYQGLKTDPALLNLYRESQDDSLPGLTLDTPVGTATDKLLVAIRDRGSFMDPRTTKDWWVNRDLPRPPAVPPAPSVAVEISAAQEETPASD